MATYSKNYKGDTATDLNGDTLSASEQTTGDIDLETNGYTGIQFEIQVSFNASGTEDIEIRVYGKLTSGAYSSNDVPLFMQVVSPVAGQTVDVPILLEPAPCHLELTAVEADTESNHGTIDVDYDAWNYTDA